MTDNQTTPDERAMFEAWASANGWDTDRISDWGGRGNYAVRSVQAAWEAWDARADIAESAENAG